jgi:lipoate-protein ligase A
MKFMRMIIQDGCDASFNMALDEAISEYVRERRSPPTIRLYQWNRPSVSIGYFQKIGEIDLEYCQRKGYHVVRRLTGGRAVLHNHELTYSISAPGGESPFLGTLLDIYRLISRGLTDALAQCGVHAEISLERKRNALRNPSCFRSASYGEITLDGRKIIGSAQKRYSNGFIQHGSIIFEYDHHENMRILSGEQRKEFKREPVRCLPEEITCERLSSALRDAFEFNFGVRIITDLPDRTELRRADELRKQKYEDPGWTFRR